MSEFVATENYRAEMQSLGPWTPASVENMQVTTIPVDKVSLSGSKVIASSIVAVVLPSSGCAFAGHTFSGGAGSIMASSTKVLTNGMPPMRENDDGFCVGVFVNNSSGATVPCSCKFKLSAAGQGKVKAK